LSDPPEYVKWGNRGRRRRSDGVLYGWCRSCRNRFAKCWQLVFRPYDGYQQYQQLRERYAKALERLRAVEKKCHVCKKRFTRRETPSLEHVIALSRGGPNDLSNLALAHRVCNSAKSRSRFNPITGQGWLL
jgi:5-methylcytosine-specific restriction endonuclease McrA